MTTVLCTCVWCLQESNGLGQLVSKASRTRHINDQKKTWVNPSDIPAAPPRRLNTSISQQIIPAASFTFTSEITLPTPLEPSPINVNNNHNKEFININKENNNHDEDEVVNLDEDANQNDNHSEEEFVNVDEDANH